MTPEDRFQEWEAVLYEIQELSYDLLRKYALKGLVSQCGGDMAYLKRLISQKYPKRHSFTDEQLQQFKQQIKYCKICIRYYNKASKLFTETQ